MITSTNLSLALCSINISLSASLVMFAILLLGVRETNSSLIVLFAGCLAIHAADAVADAAKGSSLKSTAALDKILGAPTVRCGCAKTVKNRYVRHYTMAPMSVGGGQVR